MDQAAYPGRTTTAFVPGVSPVDAQRRPVAADPAPPARRVATSRQVIPRRTRRWPRQVGRAVTSVVTVVLAVLSALALAMAIAAHLSPTGRYEVFGHPTLTVLSGSMSPTIRTGDLVIDDRVTAAQAAHLHVGQIITFHNPVGKDAFFTHRIVAVHSTAHGVTYTTKGDANDAPDAAAVPAHDVLGVYQTKIPYGGYVLNALRQPLVLVSVIAAIVLLFVSGSLFRRARAAGPAASKHRSEQSPVRSTTRPKE
jgi:signal peptidase